jgi:hypothetical protein
MAQQQAQPAGGNFQAEFPTPVSGLASQLSKQTQPTAAPAPTAYPPPRYQTYYNQSGTAVQTQPPPSYWPTPSTGQFYDLPTTPPDMRVFGGPAAPPPETAPPPAAPPGVVGGTAVPRNPVLPGTGGPSLPIDGRQPSYTLPPAVAPPTVAPPPASSSTFGTNVNLDPAYLEQQIRAAFARAGRTPTAEDISYWIGKASTPDIYSDRQVRIGWNPYWEDRIFTGSDSSDPRLAGTEGIISDPGQFGYGTFTGSDGGTYFLNAAYNQGAQYAGTTVPSPGSAAGPSLPAPGPEGAAGVPPPVTAAPAPGGSPGPGWVQIPGGGWVPPGHPLADTAVNSNPGSPDAPPPAQPSNPGDADYAQARQILEEMLGRLDPDSAALKEAQKETLLASQEAQREALLRNAAATGRSGSGRLDAAQLEMGDAFDANLTRSYRDIDQSTAAQGLANRLAAAEAFQGLGSAQSSSGLGWEQLNNQDTQFWANLQQQDSQFYASLQQQASQTAAQLGFNYAQLSQQDRQFFQSLALQQAIAANGANNDFLNFMARWNGL